MFKKFLNWLAGTKPSNKYAHPLDAVTKSNPGHPGWPTPVPQAPYKLEPPAATTPLPYVPSTTPPLVKLGPEPTPEPAPTKKPRKPAVKKPAVIKAPAKPRAKKTPQ